MTILRGLILRSINQKGFSLIETVIALCIGGALAAGIASTTYQLQSISNSHYVRVVAVSQVENAVHYLIRDVQQAQVVNPQGSQGFPLLLTWVSWDATLPEYKTLVTYSLVPTDGTPAQLTKRLQTYNANNVLQQDQTSTLASYIKYSASSPDTSCSYDSVNHKATLQITSTLIRGGKQDTETRKVDIVPRPGS
jgi:prepilin-type N-terminal cleavage/methylation domain-containing protein